MVQPGSGCGQFLLCAVVPETDQLWFKVMFSLEVLLQTPNSASVSGENGKSLALDVIEDKLL